MSRKKIDEPAQLERWEVTWWQSSDRGVLVLHSRDFERPSDARVAYATLHSTTDPRIIHHHWNVRKARWESNDVIGQAVTSEQSRDVNARGFNAVRRIAAHAVGRDSRGIFTSLDKALEASPEADDAEPLVGTSAADCVVCDYLCQLGLSVAECHATVVEQQPPLTYEESEPF